MKHVQSSTQKQLNKLKEKKRIKIGLNLKKKTKISQRDTLSSHQRLRKKLTQLLLVMVMGVELLMMKVFDN